MMWPKAMRWSFMLVSRRPFSPLMVQRMKPSLMPMRSAMPSARQSSVAMLMTVNFRELEPAFRVKMIIFYPP